MPACRAATAIPCYAYTDPVLAAAMVDEFGLRLGSYTDDGVFHDAPLDFQVSFIDSGEDFGVFVHPDSAPMLLNILQG